MYNQAYNRAQLIPMVVRVSDADPDRLEKYGDDDELDAFCDIECEWNGNNQEWKRYDFEDRKNSEGVKACLIDCYNDYKSQKIALGYLYTRIKEEQTKKALETFTNYFNKNGIKFVD